MKFCLLTNLYPPYVRGGAERVVELLVEGLKKRGQVLLITTQPDDILDDIVHSNFEIYRINPLNSYYLLDEQPRSAWDKVKWHWSDFFNFWVQKEVRQLLKSRQVDVVLTHNLKGLSLGLPKVIRKLGLPHIHTLHDYQLLDPHGSMFRLGRNLPLKGLAYALYRFLTRRFFKNPQVVICPSRFTLELHLKYGFFKKSQTLVLPNPVDLSSGPEAGTKQPSDKLRCLFIGQLEPSKGALWLLKNFMAWDEPRAELALAGDGSEFNEINKIAGQLNDDLKSRIKVLGRVSREELSELYQQADVLVLPSLWQENSPVVVYEAMAHGLPVVVSDVGGTKELVKEGKTGWIFKAGDPQDLLDKLRQALDKKDVLPAMGESALAYVNNFTVEKYLDKLLDLCRLLKK